ncbi:hypothetical protein ACFPAF_02960 [Hymenobacter endophyticus]|uniref:Uncharacterized protein n=1 Tax=Hymenobacter endophyticus TaxID=3076335 RepID=A0ABU3TDD2_9BACT|nr:hypothetical protein [Hymenobacter endophyticus]MDU0369344.1 hypothetical protein [Hymenobacter endophyticus]
MKYPNRIRVDFERPSHGWLPVKVIMNDFELDIDASDVPVNPIYLLYLAILDVVAGIASKVWWHLEPVGYYFDFTQPQPGLYRLVISYHSDSQVPEFLYETKGSAADIVLPFCRAIKNLDSCKYDEQDWPSLEEKQLTHLSNVIELLKKRA